MTPKPELAVGAERTGAVVGSNGARMSSGKKIACPLGSWLVMIRRIVAVKPSSGEDMVIVDYSW
jgi:hypothetical protein